MCGPGPQPPSEVGRQSSSAIYSAPRGGPRHRSRRTSTSSTMPEEQATAWASVEPGAGSLGTGAGWLLYLPVDGPTADSLRRNTKGSLAQRRGLGRNVDQSP